jgi:transcriptional regulator GlxA family with amidase domain
MVGIWSQIRSIQVQFQEVGKDGILSFAGYREDLVRYIKSVERVVVASGRSRRSLEKAFRVEWNRSILDEIIRARINQAKHL